MVLIQCGPVAYADDGDIGNGGEEAVEVIFRFFIHGGGGFIQEYPAGAGEENADEGQFLLFSQRKDMAPVSFFFQMVFPSGKAACFHEFHQFFPVSFSFGIESGFLQSPHRHVGFLGNEEDFRGQRQLDDSFAVGPEAGQQAKEAVYAPVREFAERFQACCGSLVCRELLGCDVNTPEGVALAREKKLFSTVCPKYIQTAAEILEEML